MKRRTFLIAPVAAAVPLPVAAQQTTETPNLSTTGADGAAESVVKTFSKAQFSALRKLEEILMPAAQDTPGALEAGAAEFLDFLIGVSPADRVALYKDGLDRLNAESLNRYKKPFSELTAEQAEPILAPLHAPWSYRGPSDAFAKFLLAAKSDLLTATANSREYITVVSQKRRSAGGVGQYWYAVE
jgi:hypothetical protein